MSKADDDISELTAYDDESNDEGEKDKKNDSKKEVASAPAKKSDDTYVAIHSSSFTDFMLQPELLKAIADCGFEHPSEVQSECIPQAIIGTDVICQAKSGMGKTAVFVLSVLQQLQISQATGPLCLVLCHTRELAYQICHEFDRFKKYLQGVNTKVFYGGVSIMEHRASLKKEVPHIVIGTPGRVLQLAEEGHLPLKSIKFFVLDECDRMLESLEMRKDVQTIFKKTPHNKQVMMFSATLKEETRGVCKKFMHNPLEIYINDGSKLTLHGLQQYFVKLSEKEKNRKLVSLLDALDFNQVVIFVKSVPRAKQLNKILQAENFPSTTIHRGMKQEKRIARYKEFKDYKHRIMVATDLLGRGIDIEGINVVINYDMADDADSYLHRVGRAGRFGTKGLTISFISSEDDSKDPKVFEEVQQRFVVKIPEMPEKIDATTYMHN